MFVYHTKDEGGNKKQYMEIVTYITKISTINERLSVSNLSYIHNLEEIKHIGNDSQNRTVIGN